MGSDPGLARPGESEQGGRNAMAESIMYHAGNRQLQDQFDSRRIADRLEEKLVRTGVHTRTTRPSSRSLCLSSSRPPTRTAGRNARQGRRARLRARLRRRGARVPGLRRQRHVLDLGKVLVKPMSACCSSTPASRTTASERQRDRTRRSAARGHRRRATDRAGEGARDLSELSALYPEMQLVRTVDLHAVRRAGPSGAGVEELSQFQGCGSPAPADIQGGAEARSPDERSGRIRGRC